MAVVSGCDASPVFKPAEHAFDDVSSFVGFGVERIWCSPCGRGRNNGFDLFLLEPFAQAVGIVSLVRQQPLWRGDGSEQQNGHGDVGDVSWR